MFKPLFSSSLPPKPVLVIQEGGTTTTRSTDFSEKPEVQNFGCFTSCSVTLCVCIIFQSYHSSPVSYQFIMFGPQTERKRIFLI